MSWLTTLFKKDTLNTQNNVDDNPNLKSTSQIIERYKVENTPFWELKTQHGWFLAVGEHRISELHQHRFNIKKYLEENKWHIIGTLILIMIAKEKLTTEDIQKMPGFKKSSG